MKFSPSPSLLVLALAVGAGAAQAQVYLEASLGTGKVNGQCRDLPKCDATDVDSRLSLGYLFGGGLGVEASWLDYARVKAGDEVNGARAKLSGWGIGGVYRYPLTDRLSLNARGGVAWNQIKASTWDNKITTQSARERSVQPYLGLGAAFALNDTYSVGLGADFTRAKLAKEKANIRAFSVVLRSVF